MKDYMTAKQRIYNFTNSHADKVAEAIKWMGPRWVFHPDCSRHDTCPDRMLAKRLAALPDDIVELWR